MIYLWIIGYILGAIVTLFLSVVFLEYKDILDSDDGMIILLTPLSMLWPLALPCVIMAIILTEVMEKIYNIAVKFAKNLKQRKEKQQ